MAKPGGGGSSSMEDPPPSRYPMMRSPMGGQHPANSSAQTHFPGRQFGAGNRSAGSRPSGTGHAPSIVGQKRDSSGFAVMGGGSSPARHGGLGQGGSSQDSPEGGNFVKLFVGSVPRTVTEDDIQPLFADHGNVLEVALIKDKRTGQQQGCCFIKYATIEEADRAIRALHNQRTLPGGIGPIQVRYADGERERLVEYKLFVGSLNRLATEKEIEEIFAPYGRVDDVYIMRDELKQSRGCAFVKYPSREMASSAINALSGTYVMKGCDQPLTVRFADPKRPKAGEMRAGPAFGGPGFGPWPQGPLGARPPPGSGGHIGGRGPPTNWRTLGTTNTVPPPHVGTRSYGSPLTQRGGPVGGASAIGGPMGTSGASMNGSLQGPVVVTAPSQQQGFIPPIAYQQLQAYAQQSSSSQKPSQLQQQLPPTMQQEQPQPSHSQVQTPQLAVHQFGQQVQTSQPAVQQFGQQVQSSQPLGQQQTSLVQIPSSQQSLPVYSQLSVSQSQLQQHVAPVLQQVSSSLQQHQLSISMVQPSSQLQQQSQLQPQLQLQTQSQLQVQLQPQTQSQQQQQPAPLQPQSQIQSNFQSQQHLFLQQQHQLHLMQPATQSQQQPQPTQTQKQQTYYQVAAVQSVNQQPSWALATQPQSVVSTPAIAPAAVSPSASIAASVVASASAPTPAPLSCSWTEHTSPEGYKYYYNSVTKESRWEKPEELTAFEQQQQLPLQQSQSQPQPQPQLVTQQQQLQPQTQPRQQQSQILQQQSQVLQPVQAMPYSGPGMVAHQPIQNLGYGQLQGVSATVEQSHHQMQQHQGLPMMQDWAWKAKPAGT